MAQQPEKLYLTHYSRVNDVERLAQDMHECLDGFVAIAREHERRDDRREAIAAALESAGLDDVVLVAGKGHETAQIVGDDPIPFDDREVARDVLWRL